MIALVVLTAVYAIVIASVILLLRRLGAPGSRAIILGCLIFGVLSGLLVAWAWPVESSIYGNIYAALVGDRLYTAAIAYLGDSYSANAHQTIPWILRIPQVYAPVSLVLSGAAGLFVQWLYNRRQARQGAASSPTAQEG
jgi:hypothetical protein